MTALLDRLAAAGHIERRPHPDDRRRILVVATPRSHERVQETLGAMHERLKSAVAPMSRAEQAVVVSFLARMQEAVDAVSPADPVR